MVSASFLADYTLVNQGADYISNAYNYDIKTYYSSYSDANLSIVRANEVVGNNTATDRFQA